MGKDKVGIENPDPNVTVNQHLWEPPKDEKEIKKEITFDDELDANFAVTVSMNRVEVEPGETVGQVAAKYKKKTEQATVIVNGDTDEGKEFFKRLAESGIIKE